MRGTCISNITAIIAGSCLSLAQAGGGGLIAYSPNNLADNADQSDDLVMYDPTDPSGFTVIGSMGVENIGFGGMDFDADGNLWAYASYYKSTGGAASGLYRVDLNSGKATPQGFNLQSLQDIAFNPVDGKMYGINTRQAAMTQLFEIDLETGGVVLVGQFSGLSTPHNINGFAFDSRGNMYLQDQVSDMIYTTDDVANPVSLLITLPADNSFSQGMTIDWSRDDLGYHAAVGYGVFPNYFSQINTFATDGSFYTEGESFGPNDRNGIPPVQPGDIALLPASPCVADITGDGTLDFFDVSAFLSAYASQDPVADFTGDGSHDFFDVSAFLTAYSDGCP